ncbi:hypothetical protein BDN70DRAFT_888913, partial [Pholiota conissans]
QNAHIFDVHAQSNPRGTPSHRFMVGQYINTAQHPRHVPCPNAADASRPISRPQLASASNSFLTPVHSNQRMVASELNGASFILESAERIQSRSEIERRRGAKGDEGRLRRRVELAGGGCSSGRLRGGKQGENDGDRKPGSAHGRKDRLLREGEK